MLPKKLSCRFKSDLFRGGLLSEQFMYQKKYLTLMFISSARDKTVNSNSSTQGYGRVGNFRAE